MNADGTFRLPYVTPEAYDVNIYGLKGSVYLKSIRFGDGDVTDQGLDFTQGVTPGELTLRLSAAGGTVEGNVQDDNQQAVPDATVVLIPESSKRSLNRLYHRAQTDSSGRYSITGIAPGEYTLFAWEQMEENLYEDPGFLKRFESRGETVSIAENSCESKQLKLIPAEETKAGQ